MTKTNCVFCNSKTKVKFKNLNLFKGKVILKQQPYFKCTKCKKEFVSSEQMQETEKNYCYLMSESALAKEWLSKEDEKAWKNL